MNSSNSYKPTPLERVLARITPEMQHRTDNRMMMAARIADVMKENNISQVQLAKMLDKHHSVITQWLSGTQNFTIDTLSDIETVLDINLLQVIDNQPIVIEFTFRTQQEVREVKPSHTSDSEPISNSQFNVFSKPQYLESTFC